MATALKMLWDYKLYVIGLVAIVAGLMYSYSAGQADVQAKWDKSAKAVQTKIERVEVVQVKETEKIVVQYRDRVQRIVTQGDTLIKEVPVYVTKEDDERCTIGSGFVRMWNAANSSIEGNAGATSEVDGNSSGPKDASAEERSTP